MGNHTNNRRLLLVDDAPYEIDILKRGLTAEGCIVQTAGLVSEAREIIDRNLGCFSFVITDYIMPGENGVEFLNYLKKKKVPAIMLTGSANPEVAVRAFQQGALACLRKPCNSENLNSIMALLSSKPDFLEYRLFDTILNIAVVKGVYENHALNVIQSVVETSHKWARRYLVSCSPEIQDPLASLVLDLSKRDPRIITGYPYEEIQDPERFEQILAGVQDVIR